jgi:hypothetical protein
MSTHLKNCFLPLHHIQLAPFFHVTLFILNTIVHYSCYTETEKQFLENLIDFHASLSILITLVSSLTPVSYFHLFYPSRFIFLYFLIYFIYIYVYVCVWVCIGIYIYICIYIYLCKVYFRKSAGSENLNLTNSSVSTDVSSAL